MKKKGVVYRMTMFSGLFMIMLQVAGETNYARFFKNIRNKEIEQEKKLVEKIEGMEEDGPDSEEQKSSMSGREKYKQERLNRIKEMRDKESK